MTTESEVARARHYLTKAAKYAQDRSPDPSTRNGAILVAGDREIIGCNHVIKTSADHVDIHDRAQKYPTTIHAERDVILQAARLGVPCEGAHLYCTWAACTSCALAIAHSGVRCLWVCRQMMLETKNRKKTSWITEVDAGLRILADAGVSVRFVEGLTEDVDILFDEEMLRLCRH